METWDGSRLQTLEKKATLWRVRISVYFINATIGTQQILMESTNVGSGVFRCSEWGQSFFLLEVW